MSTVKSILNVPAEDVTVAGCAVKAHRLEPADSFGESGDVFRHRDWRRIFVALWTIAIAKGYLLRLCSNMLLRGRSFRMENKGHTMQISIPLQGATEKELAILDPEKKGYNTFNLELVFPSLESRVPALALTPERLKCLLRMVCTPVLMEEKRFPATSESIGYGNLARSYIAYAEVDKIQTATETDKAKIKADIEIWDPFFSKISGNEEIIRKMSTSACVAGCFSSKEIYADDESMFEGCVWWSGVHALMTDVANKIRAKDAQDDVRPRLENSNFYGDFKRKMAARNINTVFSENYYIFLENMQVILSKFITAKSGVSARESAVIDSLIKLTVSGTTEVRPVNQAASAEITLITDMSLGTVTKDAEAKLYKIFKANGYLATEDEISKYKEKSTTS